MSSTLLELRSLPAEFKLAGAAAAALAASLILPWYEKSFVPRGTTVFVQQNVSAFGVFSFVEAAVLLVAAAVLYLIWARSRERGFHLPGGDGLVISLAGAWAILLLVWRLFDKPDVDGGAATVGIQWGIFGALLAAGALVAAGARLRAANRPEPPNPAEDVEWEGAPIPARPRPRHRPAGEPATEPMGERPPEWTGEPPEPPTQRLRRETDPPAAPDRLF